MCEYRLYVCIDCMCESERERERERENVCVHVATVHINDLEVFFRPNNILIMRLCVCVCERERD